MIAVKRRRRVADIGGLSVLVVAVGALSLAIPSSSRDSNATSDAASPTGSRSTPTGPAGHHGLSLPHRGTTSEVAAGGSAAGGSSGVASTSNRGGRPATAPSTNPGDPATGNRATSASVSAAAIYSDTALPTNSYLEDDTEVLLPATATVTGSSAAGMALGGAALPVRDSLSRTLFDGSTRDTYAYSQGGVLTGLAKYTSAPNQLTASASAPGKPVTRTAALQTATPPVTFDVVGAAAEALGEPASMCRATTPFAMGSSDGATATLLDLTGAPFPPPFAGPTVSTQGAFASTSTLSVGTRASSHRHEISTGSRAVSAHAVVTLPRLVLLGGSPQQVSIEVSTPIELKVSAGGVPGSARAWLNPVQTGRKFALTITAGGRTTRLGAADLGLTGGPSGDHGLRVPIGDEGQLVLGPTDVTASKGGTHVTASADLLELDFFGDAAEPAHAVKGLPPDLAAALKPVAGALQKAYRRLGPEMTGTTGTPDGIVQRLRLGHMESTITVPRGGVSC